MDNNLLIQVENLSRYYGHRAAVDDISFELHRGEVLGFLGPNGAGKSTTMQIISGNLAPSEGRVLINGIDLLEQPRQAKAGLGFLPEQPPLYRELTVDEYLRYSARLNRISRSRISQAMQSAKEHCGLTEVGTRLIGNLSKGYQQRVGIAQAIIHSPDVVIMDEPTVGLDPIQIREIRHLIRSLGKQHSVILSTHILPEVQATCDRVQIINKGQLVLSDTIAGLERRMQGSSLIVAFQQRVEPADVADLPGVEEIELMPDKRLRIHHLAEQNPADALVALSVSRGLGLYELIPERMSLEDVFVDITCADQPEQEEATS